METYPGRMMSLVRKPSAFIPFAMSFCAIAMIAGALALGLAKSEADESALAHIFRLLLIGQLPILLFFAGKWLALDWKPALGILALQLTAICAAVALVAILGL